MQKVKKREKLPVEEVKFAESFTVYYTAYYQGVNIE
jgi:hypothetical protein